MLAHRWRAAQDQVVAFTQTIGRAADLDHDLHQPQLTTADIGTARSIRSKEVCAGDLIVGARTHGVGDPGLHGDIHIGDKPQRRREHRCIGRLWVQTQWSQRRNPDPAGLELDQASCFERGIQGAVQRDGTSPFEADPGGHQHLDIRAEGQPKVLKTDGRQFRHEPLQLIRSLDGSVGTHQDQRFLEVPLLLQKCVQRLRTELHRR